MSMHAAGISSPAEYEKRWPNSVHGQLFQPGVTRLYQESCRDDSAHGASCPSYSWASYLYMAVVRQASR